MVTCCSYSHYCCHKRSCPSRSDRAKLIINEQLSDPTVGLLVVRQILLNDGICRETDCLAELLVVLQQDQGIFSLYHFCSCFLRIFLCGWHNGLGLVERCVPCDTTVVEFYFTGEISMLAGRGHFYWQSRLVSLSGACCKCDSYLLSNLASR